MEFFILRRQNYHRLIAEEDEFYYPLIFQTPFLSARYIGKSAEMQLLGAKENFKGILIGISQESLLSYFKRYLSFMPDALSATSLQLEDDEHEWLAQHLKITRPFTGIRYVSTPREPPYYILLSEHGEFLVFSSVSESELADLPKINYNRIITNEAIEQLANFLKAKLPKKLRDHPHKPQRAGPSLETKLKQLRISKFFKAAEEKLDGE
ncbi:MAG TPA: hypothetical protein VJI13_03145 [Candidatus Norongarragalinales archaeon]|nr:hypothetical protein [Candidatus Norongarragalinales archaeon]